MYFKKPQARSGFLGLKSNENRKDCSSNCLTDEQTDTTQYAIVHWPVYSLQYMLTHRHNKPLINNRMSGLLQHHNANWVKVA